MYGAIIGDLAGSIYEYSQLKRVEPIETEELIKANSFYSDDTIETIAILDAIINNKDYGDTLREYILKYESYKPDFSPYFKFSFSINTINWAKGVGKSNSIGNGAMMRISPVGYLFNSENDVIENARLATIPSHNSKEAIDCATIIALMIYYFRKGLSKEDVYKRLNLKIEYIPFTKFNTTCLETLNNCIYSIYNSVSFEDAIKKALLLGGDTDTNACIVGSVAESIYGTSAILIKRVEEKIPEDFVAVLKRVYK